jgi:hypothetical protein
MSQNIVIFIQRALQNLNHIFSMARQPLVSQSRLIIEALWSHPRRYTIIINTSQRFLNDNKQSPKRKNIHAPGGIRTPIPSKRSAADPRLRPRGKWDRQPHIYGMHLNCIENEQTWTNIKLNNKILLLSLWWIPCHIYCKWYKYFEGRNKGFCWRLVLTKDWQWAEMSQVSWSLRCSVSPCP